MKYMNSHWKEWLPKDMIEQCAYVDFYDEAVSLLEEEKSRAIILPIKNIPFERNSEHHISAVLPFKGAAFYLTTNGDIKNLSILGESHIIHYTNDAIATYIKDFNDKVKLVKVDQYNDSYEYFISTQGFANSTKLNPNEFIPEPGEGIYVVLCKKTDLEIRQRLMDVHNEETMEISNLQRALLKKCQDKNVQGIYIHRDANGHLHGDIAYMEGELKYASFSQSTTHEFIRNFLLQM
jgi:hypothetical protein